MAIDFLTEPTKDTWLTRLDPRTKIFVLVAFAILYLIYVHPFYLAIIFVLTLPFWLFGGVSVRSLAKPLAFILIFILFVFTTSQMLLLTGTATAVGGGVSTVIAELGPIKIYEEGLIVGGIQVFRIGIPLSLTLLLFASTDPTLIARGLIRLRVPFEISFMLLAAVRFFPVFIVETKNIMDAQVVRGVKLGGITGSIRRFRLLLLPLMITVLRKARTVGLAVETKGFGARKWENFYRDVEFKTADYVVMALLVILLGVGFYVRVVLGLGGIGFEPM